MLAEAGFRLSCGGQWVVVRPPELGLLLVVVSMGGVDGGFRVVICFGCGGLQLWVVVKGGNSCSHVEFVSCQLMSIRLYGSTLIRYVY